MYVEAPSSPKLKRIAHAAGTSVSHTLAVWTCMLCHAAQNEGDAWGTLRGWDDVECALTLGIDQATVFLIRQEMEGRTICGDRIIRWADRQYISDTSAERMRRWREKKTQEKQASSADVTSLPRHGDVTVTAKNRTEQNRDIVVAKATTHPNAARRGAARAQAEGFAEFWRLYPRKVGKGQAERAWERAVKEAGGDVEAIIGGLKVGLSLERFDMREAGRFCPHASTWLNGKRWLDGVEEDAAA